MELTPDQLRVVMPALPPPAAAAWAPILTATAAEFGISTPLRLAAFLAQAAQESGQLRQLEESLNYSAAGLLATWPHRFTPELAAKLARHPQAIAEHVYGGRGGNRPEGSGDGWRYRGRGIFGLTFLYNYQAAGHRLGVDLAGSPDLVAQPAMAARTAGDYWRALDIDAAADAGDIVRVTRAVNGGEEGLAERRAFYVRACSTLLAA